MLHDQTLWMKENRFWDRDAPPRIDDRRMLHKDGVAVLSYRVTGKTRALHCRSTYARACGSWMLIEHRQRPA
ncbi:hypothetical protein [Frigidibacter sp. ROC022]|uniref:hypothetical protein n=1 Tax=Frigidibacter sp. ROC022 TaxID=2971796 RepID=UPI00215A4A6E|nr:hypothetical protein [Frigidibacter sp. ROC022]MCR8725286.1 hypothetical protein [Frigidibacter sp. ROC022]